MTKGKVLDLLIEVNSINDVDQLKVIETELEEEYENIVLVRNSLKQRIKVLSQAFDLNFEQRERQRKLDLIMEKNKLECE